MRLKKKDKSSGVLISAPTSDLCDYKKSMVNADLSWMTPSNRWANIAVYPFFGTTISLQIFHKFYCSASFVVSSSSVYCKPADSIQKNEEYMQVDSMLNESSASEICR